MKVGEVAPVFKKGEQNAKNNYRPITVLTQFNQIFERLLYKRFIRFFEKLDIILMSPKTMVYIGHTNIRWLISFNP